MFSFFKSAAARRRDEARELLRHAAKVIRYRSDILAADDLAELRSADAALKALLADRTTTGDALGAESDALEALLRRHGGKLYPLGAAADWTETFVIAALLAGGVRAFIIQPFKIPTNSMYPTYHGMTAKVYADGEPAPSPADKVWRKITLGATYLAPVATEGGEVCIPVHHDVHGRVYVAPAERGKALDDGLLGTGVLKGPADLHTLFVGRARVGVVTPADFSLDEALLGAFFPKESALPVTVQEKWNAVLEAARASGALEAAGPNLHLLRTGKVVKAGEPVMRFDVLTGDMVFVDRMSYHFTAPKLGDSFVFRTSLVPGMKPSDGSPHPDFFYIKRLVGLPGDTLRVEHPVLLRNGAPATGAVGFEHNNAARHDLGYHGYIADIGGRYPIAQDRRIPEGHYWAMGDNSANSADSREWGYVPHPALVGRALFILHPFTDRWGAAK